MQRQTGHPNPDEHHETRELVKSAFSLARSLGIKTLVVQADEIGQGRLSPGLGARHAAALAITTVTDATAVVISASSGTVSLYDSGETVLELERANPGS